MPDSKLASAAHLPHHEMRSYDARRFGLPSWAGSIVFHVILLGVVLLLWSMAPHKPGAQSERTAHGGIALGETNAKGEEVFVTEEDVVQDQATEDSAQSQAQAPSPTMADLAQDAATEAESLDLAAMLPTLGASSIEEGGGGGLDATPEDGDGPGGKISEGDGEVGFMGLTGTGTRFVYVIDRSESMSEAGNAPLNLAKTELIKSIDSLKDNHQFMIVFFNEQASSFNPGAGEKLSWADRANKTSAKRFVGTITASGSTNYEEALKLAVDLEPDVIFFLTDSGEVSPRLLYDMRRSACSINVVEFGKGPDPGGMSSLKQLAVQNNGQHCYVDINEYIYR